MTVNSVSKVRATNNICYCNGTDKYALKWQKNYPPLHIILKQIYIRMQIFGYNYATSSQTDASGKVDGPPISQT